MDCFTHRPLLFFRKFIYKMYALLLYSVCVVSISGATYSKLSTLSVTQLTPNDYLISTLGQVRMTLNPQTCQVQLQTFSQSSYSVIGYYPRKALLPCRFLRLTNNSLLSSNQDLILSLKVSQSIARFDQVFVTIDEMAIVRISGIYFNQFQTSQNWISTFRAPQQFVYSISNVTVSLFKSLSFVQNQGGWGFSATQGELRLFRVDNVSKIVRYNYTGFTLTASNLLDYNSNAIPYADIGGFQYFPRCSFNNSNVVFQGPFTFVINQYWPELRLLDQTGYQILAIRYPQVGCGADIEGVYRSGTQCMGWFCPPKTFEHLGSCVTLCPPPYFHQIDSKGTNRCTLACRADYVQNFTQRTCACQPWHSHECGPGLKATPMGCLCLNGTYYSSVNQPSSSNLCHRACGPHLYAHPDGICLSCPPACVECGLSGSSYAYLTCNQCQDGFMLNQDGLCKKQCALSSNGSCLTCSVLFCKNCSSNRCFSCYLPYSLLNNACLVNCPTGFKSLLTAAKAFVCTLIPVCPSTIIPLRQTNNQSSCFCQVNRRIFSYFQNCGNMSAPCGLGQYYNPISWECLDCPIGCLTCGLDNNSQIECSSCRPDYSLFISLSKNNYCERNSILSYCPNNYTAATQTCTVNNFQATAAVLTTRSACLRNIANCIVCLWGDNRTCSFCQQGYYLHQGLCYLVCPNGTFPYRLQSVCLPQVVQKCLVEKTESLYWHFTKSTANQNADGYNYLISVNFQLRDPLNDPIGNPFTPSSNPKSMNFNGKLVNIAYSYQKCTLCIDGYGLTMQGECLPCQLPCLQCVFVSNTVTNCIACDMFHRLNLENTCEKLNPVQSPCQDGQYRNESFVCQKGCLNFYRPNYQMSYQGRNFTVNCTMNCPDGYQISPTFATGVTQLTCNRNLASKNNTKNNPSIVFFGNKIPLSAGALYSFISSIPLKYTSPKPASVFMTSAPTSRLLASQPQLYSTQFGFLLIDSTNQYAVTPLLLQLQAANINSQGSIYPANSIYGYSVNTTNTIDILYSQTGNLYTYGRACIFLLLMLTIIFLSQLLSYKTDNLFITFTVIYLVLPSLNLTPDSSALNAYSFLYGFAWSSYLEMFSNPRSLSSSVSWFDGYLDKANNNAHYIMYVDNNIMRNGWSMILFLIIMVCIFTVLMVVFKCLSSSKYGYRSRNRQLSRMDRFMSWLYKGRYSQQDFDHSLSVGLLLLFFIQNSFVGFAYYSIMNLSNQSWELASKQQLMIFKVLSVIILCLIFIYSMIRFYVNRIGGIYCIKRALLGLWLGMVSSLGGLDQNIALSAVLLILTELFFLFLRCKYELIPSYGNVLQQKTVLMDNRKKRRMKSRHTIGDKPQIKKQEIIGEPLPLDEQRAYQNINQNAERQKLLFIIIQQSLIVIVYVFLILINRLKEISVLVIWIIVNIFMISFGVQFFEMVVDFWQKNYSKGENKNNRQFYKQIRNIWDFDHSLKSLAQTTDF